MSSSLPATTFLLGTTTTHGSVSPANQCSKPFAGFWSSGSNSEPINFNFHLRCNVVSKPHIEGYVDVLLNRLPIIKRHEIVDDDTKGETLNVVSTSNTIKEYIDTIRSMLGSMDDGEISVSAYDTAWVALVEDINGRGVPQFPTSLQWIANNQLPDGSWGDNDNFSAHDRIINTLACVITLRSWNVHLDKSEKGLSFIKENISKLGDENAEHMPIGFEVTFPSLIEIARKLKIEVPDSPVLQEIYAQRNLKLRRIPKDIMHKVPTTLLHSLEGIPDLEWEKLLKLQCPDGSFLFSPSSTAFALMHTKDDNCLTYLSKAVHKFNGGVPSVYPVDLFEHIWVVDRLQRLGISRYFQSEIRECIDYVHRYWTQEGICWARNSRVHDIDDTAMGFRLLRLHGYNVSADVFKNFESGGEFFCIAGQSNQAITGMFNLYRASQVLFPGEKILEHAKNFSTTFLREKQANHELLDKWIITKDLPGEVGYALEMPWYASLPRVEARFYLEQYGGEDDVWIGKTLYRMPYVNNNNYLELAKLDYNNCQALHNLEWNSIQKWYAESNLGPYGVSQRSLLYAYYLAAASVFEPESAKVRLSWAKTTAMVESIKFYFDRENTSREQRMAFVHDFRNSRSSLGYVNDGSYEKQTRRSGLIQTLLGTLHKFSLDTLVAHGTHIHNQLHQAWEMWLLKWEDEEEEDIEAELLVRTLNLCAGRSVSEELLSRPHYKSLSDITNRLSHQLRQYQSNQEHHTDNCIQIESDMQLLVQLVFCSSSDNDIDSDIKQSFLTVARTFYYTAYCDTATINSHIFKVFFERVL